MLGFADLFVGSVAIILGAIALLVATSKLDWAMRLPKVQSMQRQLGPSGTRIFFALGGIALIAAGCAVIGGFAPGWLGMVVFT